MLFSAPSRKTSNARKSSGCFANIRAHTCWTRSASSHTRGRACSPNFGVRVNHKGPKIGIQGKDAKCKAAEGGHRLRTGAEDGRWKMAKGKWRRTVCHGSRRSASARNTRKYYHGADRRPRITDDTDFEQQSNQGTKERLFPIILPSIILSGDGSAPLAFIRGPPFVCPQNPWNLWNPWSKPGFLTAATATANGSSAGARWWRSGP